MNDVPVSPIMCALADNKGSDIPTGLGRKKALLLEDDAVANVVAKESLAVGKHVFRIILYDESQVRKVLAGDS